jgi:lipopolysaccharide export system permease protein
MKIYTKYLVREFLKLVCLSEGIFVFLYFIIDFIQKIPNFIEAKIPINNIFIYFVNKTPLIATFMMPPAALIAVIILFTSINKRNEITAVKAGGVNLLRFMQPILIATFFISVGMFLLSETVVPYTSSKANRIWKIDVKKQDPSLFYGSNQIWYKGENSIYRIQYFDSKRKIMEGVTLYFFDDAFRVIKKIDASKATWMEGRWRLEKVIIQERKEDNNYYLSNLDSLQLDGLESPSMFMKRAKEPEEMSYWQLKRYANQVKEEGYDNKSYLVDLYLKIATPFVSLILVLTGIPLALSIHKGGTPLAISLGIGISFLYIFTLGFSRSLGLSEVLPPVLSAWLGNLIFLFLGSYLMIHVKR